MTDTKRFVFSYEKYDSPDRQMSEYPHRSMIQASHDFDADCTWDAIVEQFLNFLSGIYGYNINDQVQYETLEDKIQRLRDQRVIMDDPEAWDDELKEPCEFCGH